MLRKHHHQQHILYIYIHKQYRRKKMRDEEEFQVCAEKNWKCLSQLKSTVYDYTMWFVCVCVEL